MPLGKVVLRGDAKVSLSVKTIAPTLEAIAGGALDLDLGKPFEAFSVEYKHDFIGLQKKFVDGATKEPGEPETEPKSSVGKALTFLNTDDTPHQISVANGPRTDVFLRGQRASVTFDKPGEYNYICGLHPSMKGVIEVK